MMAMCRCNVLWIQNGLSNVVYVDSKTVRVTLYCSSSSPWGTDRLRYGTRVSMCTKRGLLRFQFPGALAKI